MYSLSSRRFESNTMGWCGVWHEFKGSLSGPRVCCLTSLELSKNILRYWSRNNWKVPFRSVKAIVRVRRSPKHLLLTSSTFYGNAQIRVNNTSIQFLQRYTLLERITFRISMIFILALYVRTFPFNLCLIVDLRRDIIGMLTTNVHGFTV